MKYLILTNFDQIYGPSALLFRPEIENKDILKLTTELMNLNTGSDAFFTLKIRGFQTANRMFEISCADVRGGALFILISLVSTENIENLNNIQEFLNGFVLECKKISSIDKVFYARNFLPADLKMPKTELENLFNTFYESIPEEIIIQKRHDPKLFVFGIAKAGKTTIINGLQHINQGPTRPSISVGISKVPWNNIILIVCDAPGQKKLRKLWNAYLDNQDALIFVLDASDEGTYQEATDVLSDIANLEKLKKLPLLILLNKVDIKPPNMEILKPLLHLDTFQNRPVQVFQTSAFTNKGIIEAFHWLTDNIII
jgi:small GTP-binding protein